MKKETEKSLGKETALHSNASKPQSGAIYILSTKITRSIRQYLQRLSWDQLLLPKRAAEDFARSKEMTPPVRLFIFGARENKPQA